jgi:hypothetical protein
VHHYFSKLDKISILMIKKETWDKNVKFIFITHLNAYVSNVFLALKIMNFEYVSLTKSYSLLCGRAWMHNVRDIGWKCNKILFKSITQL